MSDFAWPYCTVLRGPVRIGTYPIGVALEAVDWPHGDAKTLFATWSMNQVTVWTIHPIRGQWYAAPMWPTLMGETRVRVAHDEMWRRVQQWPMVEGWVPAPGEPMGLMAVSHVRPVRSPVYWGTVDQPLSREEPAADHTVWAIPDLYQPTVVPWWHRWWGRLVHGA